MGGGFRYGVPNKVRQTLRVQQIHTTRKADCNVVGGVGFMYPDEEELVKGTQAIYRNYKLAQCIQGSWGWGLSISFCPEQGCGSVDYPYVEPRVVDSVQFQARLVQSQVCSCSVCSFKFVVCRAYNFLFMAVCSFKLVRS